MSLNSTFFSIQYDTLCNGKPNDVKISEIQALASITRNSNFRLDCRRAASPQLLHSNEPIGRRVKDRRVIFMLG